MEGGGFLAGDVEELGLQRVEDRVSHLVQDDVRAGAGEHRAAVGALAVEEMQRLPVVEGVQVLAVVHDHREDGSELPRAAGHPRRPEVRPAPQRRRGGPEAEGEAAGVAARLGGRVEEIVGERGGGEVRARVESELDAGARIVLPDMDRAIGRRVFARGPRLGRLARLALG